jgi:hypothetical protein
VKSRTGQSNFFFNKTRAPSKNEPPGIDGTQRQIPVQMLSPRDQVPEKIPVEKEAPDLGVRKRRSIEKLPGKDETPVLALI